MGRGVTHRSSDVIWDGKGLFTVFGVATAAAATQRFGHFVAPCDGEIVAIGYNVDADPTHATNDLSLGTLADIDSIVEEIDITTIGTGYHDLMGATQGTGGFEVTFGEVYAWGWVGGDTTGHLTTMIVIQPRGTD